jgi:hypothetical protein
LHFLSASVSRADSWLVTLRLADPSLNATALLREPAAFVANLTHALADALNVSSTVLQVSLRADTGAAAANATAPLVSKARRVGRMADQNSLHTNCEYLSSLALYRHTHKKFFRL